MDFISPISNKHNNNFGEKKSKLPRAIKPRATRSDKLHTIKFPTDKVLNMKLRTYRELANRLLKSKGIDSYKQSFFNTLLLRYGLNNLSIVNWEQPYLDTKVYMQTKLFEKEYAATIGGPYGLTIQKCLSDRKVVFFIVSSMIEWLERGGELEKIIE